jgi:hypothetical protein
MAKVARDKNGRVLKGQSLNPSTMFKKGQAGNPLSGRKPTSPEMKEARKITRARFEEILNKYIHEPVFELEKFLLNKNHEAIDYLVVRILYESIKKGDQVRLNFVLDRLLGKVKDVVDHNITGSFHSQVVDMISNLDNSEKKED